MKEWNDNPKIVWRAAIQHYPFWFLNMYSSDYAYITNTYLPILRDNNFDIVFAGHEHLFSYAYLPTDTPLTASAPSLER